MSTRYIGITLGPLGATMSLAGSPAGLWTASYLFSYLADTLCRLLVAQGVPPEAIVVPYYDPDNPLVRENREVGLYHDRILFRAGDFPIEGIASLRRQAIEDTARAFQLDGEYLSRYLLIRAAAFEADNPVAESEPILNSLELDAPFVAAQTENPLITLFTTNWKLRATPLMQSLGQWPLLREDGGYKDGCQIVSVGETRARYYVMVRGDGDGTGRILRTLRRDEQIRAFSKDCLHYCADLAALTREHDGFTVYAGGDDLLVLLPCVDGQGRAFPAFLQAASRRYKEIFSRYSPDAAISFGVTVSRVTSPLYQVLENATDLLFRQAKSRHDGVALCLMGQRGSADGLVLATGALPLLLERIEDDATWQELYGAQSMLRRYASLFASCRQPEEYAYLIARYVESRYEGRPFFTKTLPTLLWRLRQERVVQSVPATAAEDLVETACYLLDLLILLKGRGYLQ